jgi:hypothetical protein
VSDGARRLSIGCSRFRLRELEDEARRTGSDTLQDRPDNAVTRSNAPGFNPWKNREARGKVESKENHFMPTGKAAKPKKSIAGKKAIAVSKPKSKAKTAASKA